MTTKRIATAYLPSGKEIKFVFDEISDDENVTYLFFDKQLIAKIHNTTPIAFEDYDEPQPSPETNNQGAKCCGRCNGVDDICIYERDSEIHTMD